MQLRVLHCIETIGSGGVEQRRLQLAKHLDKNAFQQEVVCSYVINDFNLKFERESVAVTAITGLYNVFNFKYYKNLFAVVRKFKPHIIHGAVFEGVISAIVAGVFFRIPIVIIEETSDPQNRRWTGNLLLKFLSFFADAVVGISPTVVAYLSDRARINPSKIKLINNGVAVPAAPSPERVNELKKSLSIKEHDFVIGSVGRLRDFHKRFSDLIKAVALLKPQHPEIKLLILGAGEDLDMLKELARSLDVYENVIFAGYQRETEAFYECMDVFALASHMEGFGLVLVEAMFFRLPVVATRVGGMKDVVVDGVTGVLVERHSPDGLAKAISGLLQDRDKARQMGDAGYERAMKEYSAQVYVRKVESMYESLASKKKLKAKAWES